ncbi:DUF2528 family protein [Desulforegula conservatrix]|uniref:DUF2528 family protein n=1 Tax=Desulforegula conservatrix TaxID=153026 RepID=UPI000419503F|nr:DUF2528 family protein [Desulforegula conservatrix]
MIKKYKIDYDWKAEVRVEIDHDIATEEKLKEINDFWIGAEDRVRQEGSVLNAVLKMLTRTCLLLQIEKGYNTVGIIEEFDWDTSNGGIEGWPKMDGSFGFKLLRVDNLDFDETDMTISEI